MGSLRSLTIRDTRACRASTHRPTPLMPHCSHKLLLHHHTSPRPTLLLLTPTPALLTQAVAIPLPLALLTQAVAIPPSPRPAHVACCCPPPAHALP